MIRKSILYLTLFLVLSMVATKSGIFFDENQESGLLDLGDGDDIFYWLFRARSVPDATPLVFWLTGGPGCSSEMAVFYENGPYTINDDLSLKKNPYSWNNNANLVFIDQPVGTGFSRCTNPTHYARNEEMVAENFYKFLIKFLVKFPEYNQRNIFITGESYAGHYIPAIADFINTHPDPSIKFAGLAIGNGKYIIYYKVN